MLDTKLARIIYISIFPKYTLIQLQRQFGVTFPLHRDSFIGYQIEPFFAKIVKIKWFPVKINYFFSNF